MNPSWRVGAFDTVLEAALEEASTSGVYLIARLQDQRSWAILAQNGRLERVSSARLTGLGVQVFTADGHCGFASSDRLRPDEARRLVRQAAVLALAARASGGDACAFLHALRVEDHRFWPSTSRPLAATSESERRASLVEIHAEARDLAPEFATASSAVLLDEEWRVVRSDGTDVRYRVPRGLVRHSFTGRGGGATATAGCNVSGADDRLLFMDEHRILLQQRARQTLRQLRDRLGAPPTAPGRYRLVLDHALAKGLAHEAFGHAVETDVTERSILATDGRLQLGRRVGPQGLSIVDGPIDGDYAYQPVSASGQRRQTVEIIRDGILHSGLGDPFSSERAGSPVTGADRVESFRSRPMPRMSNIRLVLRDAIPLNTRPEWLSPAEVRQRLADAGLLAGEPTLLLMGHRGGQVSPVLGDFVFGSSATYDLTNGAEPRQPAIFSGRSLSALHAVVGAIGNLVLDAPGHCGKGSQTVPTSGGSHAFLVLEPHDKVGVGGS